MTKYDDTPTKVMLYPAIVFLVLGMTVGAFISVNGFILPDYWAGKYVHFGRVRPVHVGTVALLWLLSANVGLLYFIVQRLCGIRLWSVSLALWTAIPWWTSLILGVFSAPFGTNSGWEYAELPYWFLGLPIKAIFTLCWISVSINIFMTIKHRKFKKMYVSLWYTMGALIWTAFTYVAGNFAIDWVPGGISKVNISFFYVHNLVGLIFTPMGIATAYYFLPKIAKTPLYSHKLSMIGFWSIAFVYSWIGVHHMIHGPVSQWLQTLSIIFSIWLFIPVWTVVSNFFLTMRGQWAQYTQSVPIRFLIMGTLFYLLTCLQGPLQGLRNINEITSKTDWVIGHAHMALLGAFTYFAIGAIYYVVPYISKKALWSESLSNWHFNLSFIGSFLMFFSLWTGGFLQGLEWASWAIGSGYAEFHNNLGQLPFLKTVANMQGWWQIRTVSGLFLVFGNILFLLNMFNTVVLKPRDKKMA